MYRKIFCHKAVGDSKTGSRRERERERERELLCGTGRIGDRSPGYGSRVTGSPGQRFLAGSWVASFVIVTLAPGRDRSIVPSNLQRICVSLHSATAGRVKTLLCGRPHLDLALVTIRYVEICV